MDAIREWIRAAEAVRATCLNTSEFDVLIRHQKQRLDDANSKAAGERTGHAVKTDDPHFEEIRKTKLLERVKKINDLILAVLKNHLILEQSINEFLDASDKKYDDLTFCKKAKLCEELKPAEIAQSIWDVLTKANRLRNKIAHTLD